jgi:hypothetical protein
VPVQGLTGVAVGHDDGYALLADGTVWDWGYNFRAELGGGIQLISDVPVQASGLTGVSAITANVDDGYALQRAGKGPSLR